MAAEEIAQRTPCKNFGVFKPLFTQVQKDLESGVRKTLKYQDNGEVNKGDFYILEGQKAYVADWGDPFINSYDRPDRRLHVIFDNGTESDLLLRSLQRALNRDAASRRITDPTLGPLFSNQEEDSDQTVGYVYVLRSKSDNPFITENRKIIHQFFEPARLDLQLKDRFGFDVEPREWFLLPLPVIEEAIQLLIAGTLPKYRYEPKEGRILRESRVQLSQD